MNHLSTSGATSHAPSSGQSVANRKPPQAFDIPELVALILSLLSNHRDLVSMACTAKRYSDVALRILWVSPNFPGNPLKNMVPLFPEELQTLLLSEPHPFLLIAQHAFERFDYYAKFVRHLQVWAFVPDAYLARVFAASRPGVPLFPSLQSIHLGADDNGLHMAAPFLSPSLSHVRLNHWDADHPAVSQSSPGVTETLLHILRLPALDCLDLLDTRLPTYESDPSVVDAFIQSAARMSQLFSLDFTTLPAVFDVLASSRSLTGLFLHLSATPEDHYEFSDIVERLHNAFLPLQQLVLQCPGDVARKCIEQTGRALESLDFRIEGPLDVDELAKLTTSLKASITTLRVLRCSTSLRAPSGAKDNLYQALTPLLQMSQLRKVDISFTIMGESMFRDEQVEGIFRGWPNLFAFSLECDPDECTPISVDDPDGFGLTLTSLWTIRHCCPDLYELSLPYLDTTEIPKLAAFTSTPKPSVLPFEIHLTRCHAHNRREVRDFIHSIWSRAESSFEDCTCASLVHDTRPPNTESYT